MRHTLLIATIIIIVYSCTNNTAKHPLIDTLDSKKLNEVQALIIVDSNSKKQEIEEIILYTGDKGFDIKEAKKAQNYVIDALELYEIKKENISCGFYVNDSSYLIEIQTLMSEEKSSSNFYRYYPKSKIILDGISFDTINYLKKH